MFSYEVSNLISKNLLRGWNRRVINSPFPKLEMGLNLQHQNFSVKVPLRMMSTRRKKPAEAKDTVKVKEKKVAERIEFTPGAIMRVKLDTLHFLSFGYGDEIAVHIYSSLIFEKSKDGANPGVFADKDVRISGFVWEDMEKKFPGKAYLIEEPVGRGKVIMFADDPNFRLYWQSLNRLFLNSVLLSPSF